MSEASELVPRIHKAGVRWVLAITGGGSGALAALLTVPGASRSILEAVVPYSPAALAEWLGSAPEHASSSRTARAMAMAAYQRARTLSAAADDPPATVAGLGCTASLATNRPKRGEHRIFVAVQMAAQTAVDSLVLTKGKRQRSEEEQVATAMLLAAMADGCRLGPSDIVLDEGEVIEHEQFTAPAAWQELLAGSRRSARAPNMPDSTPEAHAPTIVFPGAFNPLHRGHVRMAEIAEQRLGEPVGFEISISNVDKPPLDYIEMHHRAGQFAAERKLWFTRAPTFVEKASLFPGCWFVVGVDTLARIAQPRYYGGSNALCQQAIDAIGQSGCRFLVYGRMCGGAYQHLADVRLPPALAALCQEVPESEFREDISSTALRQGLREG